MKQVFICFFIIFLCFASANANSNDDISETKVFCSWWDSNTAWKKATCFEYIIGAFDSANALGVICDTSMTKGAIVELTYNYAKNNNHTMDQPTIYTFFEALLKHSMLNNENFKNAITKSFDTN